MDSVRKLPASHGTKRFGITPYATEAAIDATRDQHSKLTRTWMHAREYTAPVEFSVCGDELTMFIFEKAGSVISISNPAVAEAFRQLWKMLDVHLRRDPEYPKMPPASASK